MLVIDSNPSRTVGLCDIPNNPEQLICQFDPKILLEWAQRVATEFEGHTTVYFYVHQGQNPSEYMVAATAEKGDAICVCGCGNMDKE